jgi:putative inorganic carbon (HCO3(-)) transporter
MLKRLLAFDWLLLLAVLPLVIFITPLRSLALLIIPLLWLGHWLNGRNFPPATPLNFSLLILSFALLISLYASYDLTLSLPKVVGVVYGIALFYAVASASGRSRRHLQMGVALFLLAGLVIVIVSLIGTNWNAKLPGFAPLIARIPQLIDNLPGASDGFSPNEIAGTLLWFLPLALALTLASFTVAARITSAKVARFFFIAILWACALVSTATFILTQSRSGYLGLMVAGLLILWGSLRQRKLLALGLLLGTIILTAGIISRIGWTQVEQMLLAFSNDAVSAEGVTLTGRTEVWSRAIYAIQDFPLTGMGMNLFRYIVPVLYPFFSLSADIDIAHAHNQFLQTGVDLGLPGLIAYLAIWLGLAAMLWQSWQHAAEPFSRILTLGFAATLVGSFVFGLADAVALGAKPGFMFWVLLGLISGHYHLLVGAAHADNGS